MAQYHIYENLNQNSKKIYPYLVDVQASILTDLETRIVIPLIVKEKFGKEVISNLNPVITIKRKQYILITQQMAGIPNKQIGALICECLSERQAILFAIDFLITGI